MGRQISKAMSGLRKQDGELETARWFETFRLTGSLPNLSDLSPAAAERLAEALSGDEVQAALQELLAVRLTDAPETDGSRARDAVGVAVSAADPDAAAFAEVLAGYYDDQVCALVARLEAEEPPWLAQIRSEAFSSRIISILHAIEHHTAALTEDKRRGGDGRIPDGRAGRAAAAEPTLETVGRCDPFDLGVQRAVPLDRTASRTNALAPLTPYLRRHHDNELRAVLRGAAGGGPSAFALLVGGSSTGKTRALYETLREVIPDWPLLCPADADELLDLLLKDRFRARTVLWLNETQRYLYGASGERAARLLRKALASTQGAVAVGALWYYPYLDELTAVGNSPDSHAAARALLEGPRTHRIFVPDGLTSLQQQELAACGAHDKRLKAAIAASGPNGDVIQHLTVGPVLLHAYASSEQFTKVEHALITAALDARRLGHSAPLPAALLATAADGYLSPQQRPGREDWATTALTSLTTGIRPDGSRTGIRGALTALRTVRARSGDEQTRYEPNDYLDQQTRQSRNACLGPRQLWDALVEHTINSDDLDRLGEAANRRGLYRHSALLWKRAVTGTGNTQAASRLIQLLRTLEPDTRNSAASWISEQVVLDDAPSCARLLELLREAGATHAATRLAARAAAATFDDPFHYAQLLRELEEAGAQEAASILAARAADTASLNSAELIFVLLIQLILMRADEATMRLATRAGAGVGLDQTGSVAKLIRLMSYKRADQAAATLATRAAAGAGLDEAWGVAHLLEALCEAGADQAVSTLLARRPAEHVVLSNRAGTAMLLEALRTVGDEDGIATLASRAATFAHDNSEEDIEQLKALRIAGHEQGITMLSCAAALDNPCDVALLLEALHKAGADRGISALLGRRPAEHVVTSNPADTARLLRALHAAGDDQAVATLAARAASNAALSDLRGVALLLEALHKAGADRGISALLGRRPAEHVVTSNPADTARLLRALHAAGDDQAVATLAARAASNAALSDLRGVALLLETLHKAGAHQAVATLAARIASDAPLGDAFGIALLLRALHSAGDDQAAATLAASAASNAALSDLRGVALLLDALHEAGTHQAVATLAARVASDAALNDLSSLARLLDALHKAGAHQAVATLAARIASDAALGDASEIAWLLKALCAVADPQAAATLAARAASDAAFNNPYEYPGLLEALRIAGGGPAAAMLSNRAANSGLWPFVIEANANMARQYKWGREPDGTASIPWSWQDLTNQ